MLRHLWYVMNLELECDLKKLADRAYYAADWSAGTLRRYHAMVLALHGEDATRLRHLRDWLLVPITVWPCNVLDALNACLDRLEHGKRLNRWQRLLADLLPPPPRDDITEVVAAHEHDVQTGCYDHLLNLPEKFAQTEQDLFDNPEFHQQWRQIQSVFDVASFADHKGVLRRSMGAERNLRPDFNSKLGCARDAFQPVFDAFCLRWSLYGMQNGQPLLLKFSVNLTPYGTMIFIPAYLSLDHSRDINWPELKALHNARVPGRQGKTFAANKTTRKDHAARLRQLDAEVERLQLKGDKRHAFLCQGLGRNPGTSAKWFQRLRREFKHFWDAE